MPLKNRLVMSSGGLSKAAFALLDWVFTHKMDILALSDQRYLAS